MYTKRLLDRLRLNGKGGGGFTLNPPKKDSPRYNRVLRIYLSGTRIYNADINRPYGSDLSSTDTGNESEIRGNAVQLIRTTNFVRKSSFDEWKYIIVPLPRLLCVDGIHNN